MLGVPAIFLAITFISLPWLLRGEREKRRSSPQAGVIGIADDLFHPEAYQAARVWETQLELPAPAAIAGDKALRTGKITIDLSLVTRRPGLPGSPAA
jgi:hypothetical protein